MVVYNFKTITVVPSGKDFVDVVLSKTQRKTPTIIHPQYPISRIRRFYMRKIKFASQTYHDKLTQILEEFPILDDLHPFYADLLNVLYDKDHYKLALGQLNNARHMVDNIGKDYLKLLKYGDSLYRCKQLKRAALGRMCTLMGRQNSSLAYLEQVRQHLARLPNIDPMTRTLILCGYPNVGKSSFLNKITRANVDVQPYPFTTKSLFVGHTDYQYLRWQVIDTPGILDHPLEERNTIEMQSITAMAHLRAAILYLIDISEQCGYSIKQQVDLFNSLKLLFTGKPILIVISKIDQAKLEDLKKEDRESLEVIMKETNAQMVTMSNMTEEGISEVKKVACDLLLENRTENKLRKKSTNDFMNRLHVAVPPPRDNIARPSVVPQSVKIQKEKELRGEIVPKKKKGKEEKRGRQMKGEDAMDEGDEMEVDEEDSGDEYSIPFYERGNNRWMYSKKLDLADPTWNFDVMPEIFEGKNVSDFIDPEIFKRLEELEKEEEARLEDLEALNSMEESDESDLEEADWEKVREIRKRRKIILLTGRTDKTRKPQVSNKANINPEGETSFEESMNKVGIDPTAALKRIRSESREGRKRARSKSPAASLALDELNNKKPRSESRTRSTSAVGSGKLDGITKSQMGALAQRRRVISTIMRQKNQKGEADRVFLQSRPEHLFAGKRKAGKTDRR